MVLGMTAKYSTDQEQSANQWTTDREYTLSTWSTNPFVSHRHRHETVEHRLRIEFTVEVGLDVLHEVRSEDTEKFDDDWMVIESVEYREYGVRHEKHPSLSYL